MAQTEAMGNGIAGVLCHSHVPHHQRNPGSLSRHGLQHEGQLEQHLKPVAVRFPYQGERRLNRPGPAVAPATRPWLHQREAIKTDPTIPSLLHQLGLQLQGQCTPVDR